jgi:CubicO group peptidase (beta-lactamase class C family)
MFPRKLSLALVSLGLVLTACSGSDAAKPAKSTSQTVAVSAAPASAAPPVTEAAAPSTEAPISAAPASTEAPVAEATEFDDTAAIAKAQSFFASITPTSPGCTVAVSRNGQIVWSEGFGAAKLEPLTPMTTETVVDIGSTSKQFTATSVGLLANEGKVDLSAPISTYIPGLPEWGNRVTVLQMIHHTSGIPDYIGLLLEKGFAFTETTTDADALTALAEATALDFEPETSWAYSNSNYFLLGQIVLNVTGDDLGAFVAERIFTPLGMDAVMDPLTTNPLKSFSYEEDGAGGWKSADSPWQQLGDGGIQITPTELLKWASQYAEATIGGPGMAELRTDMVPTGEAGLPAEYGYGIMKIDLDGQTAMTHSGGWGGFVTSFITVPDEALAVAGTCNAGAVVPTGEYGPVGGDIGADIAAAFLASPPKS